MKKTMLFAAIASGFLAQADVESANIVGYKYVPVAAGYSVFTATFKNCDATKVDLVDLVPSHLDGSAFASTECRGKVKVQCVDSQGDYGTTYSWYSNKSPVGWYNGSVALERGTVVLNNGEGVCVNNGLAGEIAILSNGEVDLVPANVVPAGYSFTGNSTPVDIDLVDVVLKKTDGSDFASTECRGKIKVQCVDAQGDYGKTYSWYSNKTPVGWYDGSVALTKGTVVVPAGSAFCINNGLTGSILVTLPAPVAK